MSKKKKLTALNTKSDTLNYSKLIELYPWVVEKNRKCVLSTDSDGYLCGLLMSHCLNWTVAGFYDGKRLLYNKDTALNDMVFLDVEINRKSIMSIGNHLLDYDKRQHLKNFNLDNCIQPNLIRNFDGRDDFARKYPYCNNTPSVVYFVSC